MGLVNKHLTIRKNTRTPAPPQLVLTLRAKVR